MELRWEESHRGWRRVSMSLDFILKTEGGIVGVQAGRGKVRFESDTVRSV